MTGRPTGRALPDRAATSRMQSEGLPASRRRLIVIAISSIALGGSRAAFAQDGRGSATPGKSESSTRPDAKSALPGRALPGGLREISWDDLIPEDWDPAKQLPFQDVDQISDDDPRSVVLMNALRELWDKAPTRSDLDGLRIRIPGYVVPLDMLGGRIREFLLVPYFGACIHTPPPPANQILQVRLKARRDLQTMDAIWVNGRLREVRAETSMGVSGYLLEAESVEAYREPRTR